MSAVYLHLDRTRCTGLGICESISPEHFEIDDDGDLVLLRESGGPGELPVLEEAVRSCPTGALTLAERPQ